MHWKFQFEMRWTGSTSELLENKATCLSSKWNQLTSPSANISTRFSNLEVSWWNFQMLIRFWRQFEWFGSLVFSETAAIWEDVYLALLLHLHRVFGSVTEPLLEAQFHAFKLSDHSESSKLRSQGKNEWAHHGDHQIWTRWPPRVCIYR